MADRRPPALPPPPQAIKVLIAGGFGVGKTTFVGAVSDIDVVTTESRFSSASQTIDDLSLIPAKTTTTVAMDFGRVDLDSDIRLYLFGTPGQHRFWFMWDDLARGALGAVVLADPRRLADCFGPIDYFEHHQVPFIVVINQFDGAHPYTTTDLRDALAVGELVPLLVCDARNRAGVKKVLIELLQYLIRRRDRSRRAAAAKP